MNNIFFRKYHGLGNDFIIINDDNMDYCRLAKMICHRQTGVGADGLIVVQKEPLTMKFYNQDGSIGKMCGNGLRCFINYCYDLNYITDINNNVLTLAGLIPTTIINKKPFISAIKLPKMTADLSWVEGQKAISEITYQGKTYQLYNIFMGTYHSVVFVENLNDVTTDLAEYLSTNEIYLENSNIDFVENKDDKITMKTYERGVGFTLACGTGACSVFQIFKHYFKKTIASINVTIGEYQLFEEDDNVVLVGASEYICQGIYMVKNDI